MRHRMKHCTRFLALLTALCLLPLGALADTWATLNQRIATRSGPGTQYTELGTYLREGDLVKVRSRAWDDRNDIWWVEVEFTYQNERIRAYTGAKRVDVDLQYVPVEAVLDYGTLTTYADCFAGPYYSGFMPWVDTLEAGTSVTIYEVEDDFALVECWNDMRNSLYRCWIRLDTINIGYLYENSNIRGSEFTSGYSSQTGTVNVGVLNCRTGAGTQYQTVGYLYEGDTITILGEGYDNTGAMWFKTYANGRYVYVYASMVTVHGTYYPETVPGYGQDRDKYYDDYGYSSGSSLVGETCIVQAESANARSGPGTGYSIVATVYEWERYTVLDTAVAANGRTWLKIRVNGRTCWISGGVATINGQFH